MRLRRIRNKSLVLMIMLVMLLLGINFVLVEQHRVLKAKNNDDLGGGLTAGTRNMSSDYSDYSDGEKDPFSANINIIMGYMRTGSSFTGVTLQEYPGTFYMYEPIRTIWEKFNYDANPVTSVAYPDGSTLEIKLEDKQKVILQETIDYISCNFGNISIMSLLDSFHSVKTKSMQNLQWCTQEFVNFTNSSFPLTKYENWVTCLKEVRQECLNAPVRLAKFIRLPMASVKEELMSLFPNMKVMHLSRDPRGIFNSRAQLVDTPQTATNEEIVDHCNQWADDIEVSKELATEFPDRFKTVRYEDMTEHPMETFTEICKYFGSSFEPEIKEYLTQATTAIADNGPWNFKRANPYETAMKWRSQMDFETAEEICNICEKPMKGLNYYRFASKEEMSNLELPVRGPLNSSSVQQNMTELHQEGL